MDPKRTFNNPHVHNSIIRPEIRIGFSIYRNFTRLKSGKGVEDGPSKDDVVVDGQEEGGADH